MGAIGAVQHQGAQGGGEAGGLGAPVGDQAGGADDQGGAIEPAGVLLDGDMGERLDGFAQTHVVRQHAAEAGGGEQLQPVQAVLLVGAQGGGEAGRQLAVRDALMRAQLAAERADGVAALPDDALGGGGFQLGQIGGGAARQAQ